MGGKVKIEKVDAFRWRIPKEGKMRVEWLVYASEAFMDTLREDPALEQVANVAQLPGIVGRSMAMPANTRAPAALLRVDRYCNALSVQRIAIAGNRKKTSTRIFIFAIQSKSIALYDGRGISRGLSPFPGRGSETSIRHRIREILGR